MALPWKKTWVSSTAAEKRTHKRGYAKVGESKGQKTEIKKQCCCQRKQKQKHREVKKQKEEKRRRQKEKTAEIDVLLRDSRLEKKAYDQIMEKAYKSAIHEANEIVLFWLTNYESTHNVMYACLKLIGLFWVCLKWNLQRQSPRTLLRCQFSISADSEQYYQYRVWMIRNVKNV